MSELKTSIRVNGPIAWVYFQIDCGSDTHTQGSFVEIKVAHYMTAAD